MNFSEKNGRERRGERENKKKEIILLWLVQMPLD